MARRYDPDRRQRIIDAAMRVVRAKGLDGLSHRSVAAEADVPLGSTTYHFATLDELMVAALRQANDRFGEMLAAEAELWGPGSDLAASLARLLGEWLQGDVARVELEYELYLAAVRKPVLREVAAEWAESARELLTEWTDEVTARGVVALIDGICLQVLLTGEGYDEGVAREVFRRVVGGGGAERV